MCVVLFDHTVTVHIKAEIFGMSVITKKLNEITFRRVKYPTMQSINEHILHGFFNEKCQFT